VSLQAQDLALDVMIDHEIMRMTLCSLLNAAASFGSFLSGSMPLLPRIQRNGQQNEWWYVQSNIQGMGMVTL
jgi:hypothetical protein